MKFRNKKTGEIREFDFTPINSSLLTAQSRKRLYWVGKLTDGIYKKVEIDQPSDKGIYLKDIIEDNVDEKYYITLNENQLQKYNKIKVGIEKSNCLTEAIGRGGSSTEFLTSCKKIMSTQLEASKSWGNSVNSLEDYKIRKLTPTECCRLQGLPDNYVAMVSNTQGYKGLGNGFTIPVIKHILKHILKTK